MLVLSKVRELLQQLLVLVLILCLIVVAYAFSDTGYYVKHKTRSLLGRCHDDHGLWFSNLYIAQKQYSFPMREKDFTYYCNKRGLKKAWQMMKVNAR